MTKIFADYFISDQNFKTLCFLFLFLATQISASFYYCRLFLHRLTFLPTFLPIRNVHGSNFVDIDLFILIRIGFEFIFLKNFNHTFSKIKREQQQCHEFYQTHFRTNNYQIIGDDRNSSISVDSNGTYFDLFTNYSSKMGVDAIIMFLN